MSAEIVDVRTTPAGNVDIKNSQSEAVQHFRDIREDMRGRMPFEVTNEFVLSVLCDVYDLHQEDTK